MKEGKKIKVVFAINDFVVGGAQRLIIDLFKYFDRDKFEIYLITLFQFPDKWEFYEMLPEGVKVYKLHFKKFFDMGEWVKLIKVLRETKPDVVVSNIFLCNSIFRILKIFLRYKIIVVEHNTYIYKTRAQIFLDKILSYITEKIVAVSKTVASFTAKQEGISADKFIVIHNGIDLDKINEAKKNFDKSKILNEIGANENDKIIVNVTRLTKQKNPRLLIEGFSIFAKRHPDYKLIIIGDGSLRNELEARIIELGMQGKILLLGVKKNVYDYYLVSDFFVSTSIIEGLSIAYIEAMACGLPIVATFTAGTDEIIKEGQNGFFINESSVGATVEAMEKAINSDFNLLRKNALKTVKNFDIRHTANKYGRLIEKCISS